ncbi:hypothetical protein [Nostoc sp.]|uniref:hypothetical protein n=1 Tax=Nostoc sp. TaxID=1180 RepID=UPI002FF65C86
MLYQVRLITYDMSLRVKRSGTKQSLRTLRLLHFAIAAFVMTSIYPDMILGVSRNVDSKAFGALR